jgi:hypothetical protein
MRAALFSKDGTKRLAANPVNHIACTIRAFGAHAIELSTP